MNRASPGGRRPSVVPISLPSSVLLNGGSEVFHRASGCVGRVGRAPDARVVPVLEAAKLKRSLCQLCFPNPDIVLDFDAYTAQVAAERLPPPRLGRGDAERLRTAGVTVDEYAMWDRLGFTVLQTLDLMDAGLDISTATAEISDGVTAIEVWRSRRTLP